MTETPFDGHPATPAAGMTRPRLARAPVRCSVAFVGFASIAIVLFFPLIRDPGSSVLFEPGDLSSTARDYWAAEQHGKSPFTFEHDSLIFAPEGQERAPSLQIANAVQPAFVLALEPWTGYVGALNLYMLLGFVLTGVVTFALLDRLRLHPLAAGFGAFAFAFSWVQYEQAFYGHIGLNHLWVLPLLVLELLWLRRSRSWAAAAGVGATVGLSFYVFSYLGLFASTLVALFMLMELLDRSNRGRRSRALACYAVAATVGYATLFPALLASLLVPSGFSNSFAFTKEYFYGARLIDYVLPSVHHPVLGRFVEGDSFPPHAGEAVLFFGFSVLALASFAVLFHRRAFSGNPGTSSERAVVGRFAVLLVGAGVLFSLPAYAEIGGRKVPLPDAAFVIGSFVNWWKVYSRFAVLAGLGLAILAALALHVLLRRRGGIALGAAFGALLLFELLPGAPAPVWNLNRPSPTVRWLQAHPGGIVAHYPMLPYWDPLGRGSEEWSSRVWTVLFDQTRHGHPLYANPSLPMDGSRTEAIRLVSMNLERRLTPQILRAENVRYVVVDRASYANLGIAIPRPHRNLHVVARLGSTTIYRVGGPRADVESVLTRKAPTIADARGIARPELSILGQVHPVESYRGLPARWMLQDVPLEITTSESIIPMRYRLILHGFSNKVPRRLEIRDASGTVVGRTVVDTPDQTYVIDGLSLPRGRSRLLLRVEPGPSPLGGESDRLASLYVIQLRLEALPYVSSERAR